MTPTEVFASLLSLSSGVTPVVDDLHLHTLIVWELIFQLHARLLHKIIVSEANV